MPRRAARRRPHAIEVVHDGHSHRLLAAGDVHPHGGARGVLGGVGECLLNDAVDAAAERGGQLADVDPRGDVHARVAGAGDERGQALPVGQRSVPGAGPHRPCRRLECWR